MSMLKRMRNDDEWKKVVISKKFEFSASHRYWRNDWSNEKNEEVFGLCTSPHGHGHNYELHVSVRGRVDPVTGMIINLTDLKKYVNIILQNFDHKFLNLDTPYFKKQIPRYDMCKIHTRSIKFGIYIIFNKLYKIRSYSFFFIRQNFEYIVNSLSKPSLTFSRL